MLVVASKISFSELTISTFHKLPSSDAESHYHPLPMTCLLHCAWLLGALLLHYLLLIKSSMFPILAIFMPYAIALVKKWIQFWISTQPFPFPFPFPTMISKPFLFPNCWEPWHPYKEVQILKVLKIMHLNLNFTFWFFFT